MTEHLVVDVVAPSGELAVVWDDASLEVRWHQLDEDPPLGWEPEIVLLGDRPPTRWCELLETSGRLRWVHWAGIGTDAPVFANLHARGILVTNSRGIFDAPMAEYVATLVLALAKDLKITLEMQARRAWVPRSTRLVTGSHAVVVGMGTIGQAVARTLRNLGLSVEMVARTARIDAEHGVVRSSSELAAIVSRADFLVLAAPLTSKSRGLVGREVLGRMPRGSYLINVGRGALVDEPALIEALRVGHLAGAGLDVVTHEPLPARSPLWELPGVIVSPHMSPTTADAWPDALERFRSNLERWRSGTELHDLVSPETGEPDSDAR